MIKISFIFFGSSPISVRSLEELERAGLLPVAVVTQPDRPQGRGLVMTPSPVKTWAMERGVSIFTELDADGLKALGAKAGVLVSYGRIIPDNIIGIFPKGIINLHPSLLPLLRGPSPIESSILRDMKDEIGVTIMLLDSGMDTGPILAQKKIDIDNWPPRKSTLYSQLSDEGAKLLAETLPLWIEDRITPKPQSDGGATYSKIVKKSDGELNLSSDPYQNFLKICAYEGWPGTYFFVKHGDRDIRVKIVDARFENGTLNIVTVVPEGKKPMSLNDFKKGYNF